MSYGKIIRLKRLFSEESKKSIIVPMDHGVTEGPTKGIIKINEMIETVLKEGVNGVIIHKGLVSQAIPAIKGRNSLILHMSASTNIGTNILNKVKVCNVIEAVRAGADAVSVHINFGSDSEPDQIRELAQIAEECNTYDMPLIVMAYPRGEGINEHDPNKIAHAARIAAELGADIVKCNYTGDKRSFEQVINSCHLPILVAGGAKIDNVLDLFTMIYDALDVGAAGLSIGRNIFEHKYPDLVTKQIVKIVSKNINPEKAFQEFKQMESEHELKYKNYYINNFFD